MQLNYTEAADRLAEVTDLSGEGVGFARSRCPFWVGVVTNAIENFNRQLRKVTKAKSVFPTDDSLLKMLYLAMMDITKKWTGRRQDWGEIHSQLEIFFADRIPG